MTIMQLAALSENTKHSVKNGSVRISIELFVNAIEQVALGIACGWNMDIT